MELYTAGTGNGQRAAIAVNECGVPCKIHVLNLGQGDQKAADYLKINPTARIPTLIDPGGPAGKPLTVTQSWAILMYLCEKTSRFLPADPVARVRMFQWMAEGAASGSAKPLERSLIVGARDRFGFSTRRLRHLQFQPYSGRHPASAIESLTYQCETIKIDGLKPSGTLFGSN